ncbi:Wzz/FepE/Etk N-terminal domain-containing protein [Hydrogenimonas sp.]
MKEKQNSQQTEQSPQIIPYGYMPYCPPEEDEIDLRELWKTLKKRKRTIWLTTGAIFALALVYLFFATSIYEAKALIRIGSISGKPLENVQSLKFSLERDYHVNDKNIKRELPYVQSVSIPKKSNDLLDIIVYGKDNASATGLLEGVKESILRKHRGLIEDYVSLKKELMTTKEKELEYYKERLEALQERNEETQKLLQKAIDSQNLDQVAALSTVLTDNMTNITTLNNAIESIQNAIHNIEVTLSPLNIKPTQIVGGIVTYDHPVKPKTKLILAVSLITGLMLGVFLAFFMEFIANAKESEE